MFGNLTDQFSNALKKLSGKGKISESNVREAMDEVRTALLEADVHYEVVEQFCENVQQQALGEEVLSSLKPGQQMIKIVHDELVATMSGVPAGQEADEFEAQPGIMFVSPGPTVVMMSGLQGSGKTTTTGKLAAVLKKQGKKVMVAAADLQRPAAVHQLEVLANQVNEEFDKGPEVLFHAELDKVAEYGKAVGAAVTVCRNAVAKARAEKCDVVILDTAGRLHVNDELMGELRQVQTAVQPHQIMLVIDAMTGQDAVNSAKAFNSQLELDGVILTKFDSDTRGGAALSIKAVTGKPIKFLGMGEDLDALEEFRPEGLASRILGFGDIVGLVQDFEKVVDEKKAEEDAKKLLSGNFDMWDFLEQIRVIKQMGSLSDVFEKMPFFGNGMPEGAQIVLAIHRASARGARFWQIPQVDLRQRTQLRALPTHHRSSPPPSRMCMPCACACCSCSCSCSYSCSCSCSC